MAKEIYRGLRGEVLTTEIRGKRVVLYDNTDLYHPNIILPNFTAAKAVRDYMRDNWTRRV